MASPPSFLFVFLASFCMIMNSWLLYCNADPTDGFTSVPLNEANLVVQRPYNVPLNDRYSFINGVHKMWLYSTDKSFKAGGSTEPRTEIRIKGYDYSSGVWQFEGYLYVPKGTSGFSVMQIHRSNGEKPATDLMLKVFNGELRVYSKRAVESNIYDRWMRVNVIHDVDSNKLTIFIDGVQKLQRDGRGVSNFFFKFGVYEQFDESHYMESRWRDIKVYKKY